ncbi:MAG TPA: acyl-CoA dehydrogenase family protein [Myxococcota bacterium]|nr:acyl-CoA dehydrogenase family protein [Myxococcota bacterium]
MNFDLSDEQELLQETVRQFAANECPANRVRAIFDGDVGHDGELWKGLVELGLGAIAVPDEFGGAGLELLDQALVAEVLGAAAVPGPFLGHSLAGLAVLWGGSDAQKKTWLPKLASGELLGTVAFAEGDERWQPDEWALAGGPTLSGVKTAAPFGAHADLVVVGTAGGGLALVERGARGLSARPLPGVDRTRRIAELRFENTPCESLPNGVAASARVRDAGLVLLAADAFGGAQRLLEMSVEYAKTRQQFGVTIGSFQGLKHQLANLAVEIEPARGLYWYAAHAFDHVREESERTAALAKAHLTHVYMQAARDSVEAHGGIGFTWECDVQIYFKRAMFDRAFLGTPATHRERAAALAGW